MRKLFASASLMAVTMCAASPSAMAAQVTEDPGSARINAIEAFSGDIVVTANKKKDVENVQDVPLSVTAFNSDTLDALKVRDLESLSMSAPNVSLNQVGTTRGVANFSIRGLGVNSSIPSIDPTVGVFVDGVYLGMNNGVVFDMFDLDSVEILRGPQGILFGRNTTGGAVLVNTGNPTDDFTGKFKASAEAPIDGGRGGWNMTVQGTVSGPVVADVLNFKLGAYYNSDDGYFRNLATGGNHGAAETVIVRGAAELRPAQGVRILAKGEYFDSNGDGPAGQNHGWFARDSYDLAINEPGFYDSRAWMFSLRTDIDVGLGDGRITNIFGYRDYRESNAQDIDSLASLPGIGAATLFHTGNVTDQEQYSNELRYAGSFGLFDVTAGGYWFSQKLGYDEFRNLGALRFSNPPVLPPGVQPLFYGGGRLDHDVLGVFGQVDAEVHRDFHVIAGVRWSREQKAADVTYIRPRAACSMVAGTCPLTGFNPTLTPFRVFEPNGFSDARTWESLSPKVALQYHFGENQAYASWTRGYRSGGYNFRNTDVAIFVTQVVPIQGGFSFDTEKVDSYEAGVKLQTADRAGTLNAAVFYTKIGNMQREVNTIGAAAVVQNILNTADADIWGIEAEGRYAITGNLLLSANLGYINASYQRIAFDISGASSNIATGIVDAADYALALPRVPEWTVGFGLVHELDLGASGSLVTRANFQHRDAVAYTDNNFGWIPANDDVEAVITWNVGQSGRYAVSLYGKNLLDDVQFGGDTQLPFGGGPLSDGSNSAFDPRPATGTFSPLSKGRRIGLELTAAF